MSENDGPIEPATAADRQAHMDKVVQNARIGAARMLPDSGPITDELHSDFLVYLREFMRKRRLTLDKLGLAVDLSAPTLSTILAGKTNSETHKHLRTLDKWIEGELLRESAVQPGGFVRIGVAKKIFALAMAARKYNTIALGYGPAGMGKSLTLRAIQAEVPAAIYVSMKTGCESPLAVAEAIGRAARVSANRNSFRAWIDRLEETLTGSGRLLLIDEVHKLIGYGNDKSLHVLRDLHDTTGIPMLWLGTTEILSHIQLGQSKGREPFDQLASRISYWTDLAEGTATRGGRRLLYTAEEIRQVFAQDKLRITPDAYEFLLKLANLPHGGHLRSCRKLLDNAADVARGEPITAALLMEADAARSGPHAAARRRTEMDVQDAAPRVAKVG
jgi:DNA transposition AAA+ family ATPase